MRFITRKHTAQNIPYAETVKTSEKSRGDLGVGYIIHTGILIPVNAQIINMKGFLSFCWRNKIWEIL